MFKKIVVALDGSPFGEFALPMALSIAASAQGTVRLLTIITPLPVDPSVEDRGSEEAGRLRMAREHAEKYQSDLTRRIAAAGWEVPLSVQVETGSVVEELDQQARSLGADLLVMTTHGRGPLRRAWLGSVADGLLRRTPCPILVVRPREGEVPGLDSWKPCRILVPLDGSAESQGILRYAQALAGGFGAGLTLFRVVPSRFPLSPHFPSHGNHGYGGWDGGMEMVRKGLEGEAESLRTAGLEVAIQVATGTHPAEGILDQAASEEADLVAMTTHGRGGVARMILGSVADKVVRGGSAPVLLHRAD